MKISTFALLFGAACRSTVDANTCADYGDSVVCAGGHCYECNEGHCSTDGPSLKASQCGDDVAEPSLATSCTTNLRGCLDAAAGACNKNRDCNSFSINPSWSSTAVKLWKNSGEGLVPNLGWNTWVPTNKTTPPSPAPAPPGKCGSDLDCSLNGVCDSSTNLCVCDKPWSGLACETLNFKPVTFPQGYGMAPNVTTWGGNVLFDGQKHHMFVSRMTNDCSLQHWTSNSRVDHAVSATGVEGPYLFADVAINTWAHNAAPLELADGTYAIVHIGTGTGGPDGGANCTPTDGNVVVAVDASVDHDSMKGNNSDAGSTIHVSKSLDGPWLPLTTSLGGCNNPAPWVHKNGTIYIGCGGSLKRAENLAGPYTTVASFPMHGGPEGNYEDPQVYVDARGHFHCLYHVYTTNLPSGYCVNSTVSAHSFSEDGLTWKMSSVQPYGTQVKLSTGDTVTVATRERPKPFFQNGVMTHLLNGVCGSALCASPKTKAGCVDCKYAQWDYTLVAPLDV